MDRHPSGTIRHDLREEEFRGKGIAGRMHEAAGSPPHSSELTDMGNRWRQKVGGEQPEERGEARQAVEPLDDRWNEIALQGTANEIKEFGKLKSRESFHGSG